MPLRCDKHAVKVKNEFDSSLHPTENNSRPVHAYKFSNVQILLFC